MDLDLDLDVVVDADVVAVVHLDELRSKASRARRLMSVRRRGPTRSEVLVKTSGKVQTRYMGDEIDQAHR